MTPWRTATMLGVGSSTMEGYLIPDKSQRWWTKFIRMLQREFPAPGGTESAIQYSSSGDFTTLYTRAGVHGYNMGQASTTSETYLNTTELAKVSDLNPDTVFHMVGSNDMAADFAPSRTRSNILYRLDRITTDGYCPHLYIHQHCRNGEFEYEWSTYRDVWLRIEQERPGAVGVLDVSDAFRIQGIPGSDGRNILQSDNTHLTVGGQAIMARYVFDKLIYGV
jgi:lysophospholipase L1-like esterase